jgi:hypothetical protein
MTYRERRLAKAEKLVGWAEKRQQKAVSARKSADAIAAFIPFGQPILVGHHSEKRHRRDLDRINGGYEKSFEHANTAADMLRRAEGIEAAAARAIYSDDADAIEQLEKRIATLEAAREVMKAFNKTVRKGTPDFSLLTESQAAEFRSSARYFPWIARKGFDLANTSGNIKRNRDRLAQLKRVAANDAKRTEREAAGATIASCVNADFVEVSFPERPERAIIEELKGAGFSWSATRSAWAGLESALPERFRMDGADG